MTQLYFCCGPAVLLLWSVVLLQWLFCDSVVLLLWLSYTSVLALQIIVSLTRPWSASRIWTIDSTWSLFSIGSWREDRHDISVLSDYSPRSQHIKRSALDFERIPMPCESKITEYSLCELTDLAWKQCQFWHFASSRTTATYLFSSNWDMWSSQQTALSYHET